MHEVIDHGRHSLALRIAGATIACRAECGTEPWYVPIDELVADELGEIRCAGCGAERGRVARVHHAVDEAASGKRGIVVRLATPSPGT